ncbi:type II toxin-antitoxin system VapC family toxin [Sphingomonas sp. 8AM]|uniref:type II toxin-antitoxin system VapC family toxin n=1 Tax=Sphingomonas sp. 8AM TaxID=2653170 RepID=UPI00135B0892|nr:type II toxin-antitoxin system VapC family toxin [Sphingomonas sp. 8AM]
MKAVDTNILVRWLTRDDPVQTPAADRVMAQPVFVAHTVFLELAWVLAGRTYRLDRARLAVALRALIDTQTVHIADEEAVRRAIERFAAGGDIADMLHLTAVHGCSAFVSFERGLDERAGPHAPVPVEQPA